MITLLMVLFLLVSFCLMVIVLLQAGKGGGLAAGFGGAGTGFELLGGRQTATFLHQATRWLGGAFLLIAFLIALLTARGNRPSSLIEREFQGQPQPVQQSGTPRDLGNVVGQPQSNQAAPRAAGGAGRAGQKMPQASGEAPNAGGAAPQAVPVPGGGGAATSGAPPVKGGAAPEGAGSSSRP